MPVDGARPSFPSSSHVPIAPVAAEPHPAEEMEQTLERLNTVGSGPAKPAIHAEPVTMPGVAGVAVASRDNLPRAIEDKDDETETTQMSPELRARIDQLMSADRPPKSGPR